MAFNLPYVCDYITKFCIKEAEISRNYENEYIHSTGHMEARCRKYKRFEVGGSQAYDH
jgi:hypothetical protein